MRPSKRQQQTFLELARQLLDENGLQKWKVRLMELGPNEHAWCYHNSRTLRFAVYVAGWEKDEQQAVLLHEIAHAKLGPRKGHGMPWVRMCLKLGMLEGDIVRDLIGMWSSEDAPQQDRKQAAKAYNTLAARRTARMDKRLQETAIPW